MKFWLRRLLCSRCPLNENRDAHDRRKVSPEGRERWEEFTREKADVERRLDLVDVQTKVIAHVTNGHAAPAAAAPAPGPGAQAPDPNGTR